MFAPWCPSCSAHVLLGTRRLEQIDHGPGGPRVVLRCYCDTLLVWSAASERSDPAASALQGRCGTAHPADLETASPTVAAPADAPSMATGARALVESSAQADR